MSKWTHALCTECYELFEPGREPSRLAVGVADIEACCNCGRMTGSGIYYRCDPEKLLCKGKHD